MPGPITIGAGDGGRPASVDPRVGGVLIVGGTGSGKTFAARLILGRLVEVLEEEGLEYSSLIPDYLGEYEEFRDRVARPGVVPVRPLERIPARFEIPRVASLLRDFLRDPSPLKVVVLDGVLNRLPGLAELAATLLLRPGVFALVTLQTLGALHPSQAAPLAEAPHKLLFWGYDYGFLPPDLLEALGLDDGLIPTLSKLGTGEALLVAGRRRALVRIGD